MEQSSKLFEEYRVVVQRLIKGRGNGIVLSNKDLYPGEIRLKKEDHVSSFISSESFKNVVNIFRDLTDEIDRAKKLSPKKRRGIDIHNMTPLWCRTYWKGLEEELKENRKISCYELSKHIFQVNLEAAEKLLKEMLSDILDHPPDMTDISPSLIQIWKEGISSKEYIIEVLKKLPAESLLIILVSLIAGGGANSFMQEHPEVVRSIGKFFNTRDFDPIRYLLTIVGGISTSYVVWSVKNSVLRSIADVGSGFKGIEKAITKSPLETFLAASLFAGGAVLEAEGIRKASSVVTDRIALVEQAVVVSSGVEAVLLNAKGEASVFPQSLPDLKKDIRSAIDNDLRGFRAIIEDERGESTRGTPDLKGPAYWQKYFLVNGGYEAGVHDVRHSFKGKRGFAIKRDNQIKKSEIDFKKSLEDKMTDFLQVYETHVSQTEAVLKKHLQELNALSHQAIDVRGIAADFFSPQKDQISNIVENISEAMESQNHAYETLVGHLRILENEYLDFIKSVEPSVNHSEKFNISEVSDLPDVGSIQNMSPSYIWTRLAEVQTESSQSLNKILYSVLGGLLLFSGVGLFRQGKLALSRRRNDDLERNAYEGYLKEWEKSFVDNCDSFFAREDIHALLPEIGFPGKVAIWDAYYRMLDEIKIFWKKTPGKLTGVPHTSEMDDYNTYVATILEFVNNPYKYLPRFIELIFPGLENSQVLKKKTFTKLAREIALGQKRNQERLVSEKLGNDEMKKTESSETDEVSKMVENIINMAQNGDTSVKIDRFMKPDFAGLLKKVKNLFKERKKETPITIARQRWIAGAEIYEPVDINPEIVDVSIYFPEFIEKIKSIINNDIPHMRKNLQKLVDLKKEHTAFYFDVLATTPTEFKKRIDDIVGYVYTALFCSTQGKEVMLQENTIYPRNKYVAQIMLNDEKLRGKTINDIEQMVEGKLDILKKDLSIAIYSVEELIREKYLEKEEKLKEFSKALQSEIGQSEELSEKLEYTVASLIEIFDLYLLKEWTDMKNNNKTNYIKSEEKIPSNDRITLSIIDNFREHVSDLNIKFVEIITLAHENKDLEPLLDLNKQKEELLREMEKYTRLMKNSF